VNPCSHDNECAKLVIVPYAVQTEMADQWHYVYYSYEQWGRGYIGRRSSKVHPSIDPYMGSFTDKTFAPTSKIILAEFDSVEEAIQAEINLHVFFAVDSNPHFANRARQTSTGFAWNRGCPTPRTGEQRQAMSNSLQCAWQEPEKRQKWLKGLRRAWNSESRRQAHRRARQSSRYRNEMSLLVKQRWENDDFRREQIQKIQEMSLSESWKKRHLDGCNKNRRYLYILTSPSGETFRVESLRLFCLAHKLNQECMRRVASGERRSHHGWKGERHAL
jgi:hypothetical protein